MSLKLEDNELFLWRNYDRYDDGEYKSAADDSYRLTYSACSEGLHERLRLHEAMYRVINVLAGVTETITDDSSDVSVSKSQLLAMSSVYSQIDSSALMNDLSQSYEEDVQSARNLIKKNNIA